MAPRQAVGIIGMVSFPVDFAYPYFTRKQPVTGTRTVAVPLEVGLVSPTVRGRNRFTARCSVILRDGCMPYNQDESPLLCAPFLSFLTVCSPAARSRCLLRGSLSSGYP
jgi:hypothetical protein